MGRWRRLHNEELHNF